MMPVPLHIQRIVAIHEAGHAVVMLAQGSKLSYITIVPEGLIMGHVKPSLGGNGDPLCDTVAGDIAVELVHPGGWDLVNKWGAKHLPQSPLDEVPSNSDSAMAERFANWKLLQVVDNKLVFPTDEQKHNEYVSTMVKAIGILEANALALTTITKALLQFKRIDGAKAARIFEESRHLQNRISVLQALDLATPKPLRGMESRDTFFEPLNVG